ncbi:MAG: hypothetical protein IJT88_09590 [Kiritimatiellae bacterium]|nr:hypothetical protein [Kiritimatiellia bacterium]
MRHQASIGELREAYVEGMDGTEVREWQHRWEAEHGVEDMRTAYPPYVIGRATAQRLGISILSAFGGMRLNGKAYRWCPASGFLLREDFFDWIVEKLKEYRSEELRERRRLRAAGATLPGL